MKIDATQTKPITVDIDDAEVYRITRETILDLIGMQYIVRPQDELEIIDDKLVRVYWESFGPYDPDKMREVLRDAIELDLHVIKVLEALKISQ
jgi:hypothetical protein